MSNAYSDRDPEGSTDRSGNRFDHSYSQIAVAGNADREEDQKGRDPV